MARPSLPGRDDADRAWDLMGGRPGAGTGRRVNEALDRHPVSVLVLGVLLLVCAVLTGVGMVLSLAEGRTPAPAASVSARP